jgi:hypothetical protein
MLESLRELVTMIEKGTGQQPPTRQRDNGKLLPVINVLKGINEPVTIMHLSSLVDGLSLTGVYRIVAKLKRTKIVDDIGSTVAKISIKDEYRHANDADLVRLVELTTKPKPGDSHSP